jgi:uncharacterized protein YndB with AHSA1/START domain
MEKNKTESADNRTIVMERVVNAPRELVWDAMTNPKHVVHWWGPRGFRTTEGTMDLRVGGSWKHTMIAPDGTEFLNEKYFREVVKPERLVFTHGGGKKGEETDVQSVATWTFEAVEKKKTRVTIRMVFPTPEERNRVVEKYGAIKGGEETLARLDEFLARPASAAGAPEWEISRTFDAPRKLVWRAWTDPKQMAQWWGPKDFTNPVCDLDVRIDGAYRITMRAPDGEDYPMHGFYREIVEPERLVYTADITDHPGWWFDQVDPARDKTKPPKVELIQMATFEELVDGKTKLTVKVWFESASIRDNMVKMGMNMGWSMSFDRLEALLKT